MPFMPRLKMLNTPSIVLVWTLRRREGSGLNEPITTKPRDANLKGFSQVPDLLVARLPTASVRASPFPGHVLFRNRAVITRETAALNVAKSAGCGVLEMLAAVALPTSAVAVRR